MDDLSRALDETLLSDLECPRCMEYMVPPITLCTSGHNICSKCIEEFDHCEIYCNVKDFKIKCGRSNCKRILRCCPICSDNFSTTRSVALESIARRQKYPCVNRENGCSDLLSIEHIAEHQAVCKHGSIKCPLNKTIFKCSWMGFVSDLEKHAKAAHPVHILKDVTFNSSQLQSEVALVFCFDKVFLYYKKVLDGRFYCAVQLIGPSRQASKFRCEFKLRATNEIDEISKTFLVRSYSEDFETSFNSGKCLRLDDISIRNFVKKDKLNLIVKIFRK